MESGPHVPPPCKAKGWTVRVPGVPECHRAARHRPRACPGEEAEARRKVSSGDGNAGGPGLRRRLARGLFEASSHLLHAWLRSSEEPTTSSARAIALTFGCWSNRGRSASRVTCRRTALEQGFARVPDDHETKVRARGLCRTPTNAARRIAADAAHESLAARRQAPAAPNACAEVRPPRRLGLSAAPSRRAPAKCMRPTRIGTAPRIAP